jgi:thioesterase domain-containing protein
MQIDVIPIAPDRELGRKAPPSAFADDRAAEPAGETPAGIAFVTTGLSDFHHVRRLAGSPSEPRLLVGLPSTESRITLRPMARMARDCAAQIGGLGRVATVAGCCAAGFVAQVTASRLSRQGQDIERLVLVETYHPLGRPPTSVADTLAVDQADLAKMPSLHGAVMRLEEARRGGLRGQRLLEAISRVVDAHVEDILVLRGYELDQVFSPAELAAQARHFTLGVAVALTGARYRPARYRGDVVLVFAADAVGSPDEEATLWRRTVDGDVRVVRLPLGYRLLLESPALAHVLRTGEPPPEPALAEPPGEPALIR